MVNPAFTTTEDATRGASTGRILWRYLSEVSILRLLVIPNLIFGVLIAAGSQLFLWLNGRLVVCGGAACDVTLPAFSITLTVSFAMLALLALLLLIARATQWCLFESGGQLASGPLFRQVVVGLGRVRTTFFDEFPSGKIINRIVRDFDQLRTMGPIRIGDSGTALIELLFATALVAIASPGAALVAAPTLIIFFYIQANVAPMLQRTLMLRSARFGEVLHRETDVIEGARIFLLYGQRRALFRRLQEAVSRYIQMHLLRGRIEAWGRFWCDVAVAAYAFIALLAVSFGLQRGSITDVTAVVIITAIFRLGAIFGWLTWSFGYLFETAGHGRRVFEYVDLPSEEREERSTPVTRDLAQAALPTAGNLTFDRYTMSYRTDSPVILKCLSLEIEQGSKVGIVGRTGAGKTSFVQALYRMVHVQAGDIRVGAVSLFSFPPRESRKLFAVVPQDPYLFEGTVRSNLDRYGEQNEEDLLRALQSVRLELPLTHELHEGGSNLSLGERQLLCLARVIISARPFVIMDEPTSGIDAISDAIIQAVLRTALKDRTVITIAHRLETLSRVDRIIEFREGAVLRDGPPSEILPSLTEKDLDG